MAQRKAKGRGWIFRWREVDPATGKLVRRTSEEYAKRITAEVEEAKKQRELVEAKERERARLGAMLFTTVIARWKKAPNKSGQPKSERYQRESERDLIELAKARKWETTGDITADDIDAWHADVKGVNRILAVVKSVLKFARRTLRQPVDAAVFDYSPRPGNDTLPPDLLTVEDIAGVIATADAYDAAFAADTDGRITDGRMGTLVRHHIMYGPRSVTLAALTVGDYNEVAKKLTLRRLKNGRTLEHPVHDDDAHHQMARRLSKLCAGRPPDAPLYRSPTGESWFSKSGQHGIAVWFRRHCLQHLPVSRRGIYLLKDWAITQMELAGIDDRTKATFTGHTSMRSFLHYKGTNQRMAQSALERIPALPEPAATGSTLGSIAPAGSKLGSRSNQRTPTNHVKTAGSIS